MVRKTHILLTWHVCIKQDRKLKGNFTLDMEAAWFSKTTMSYHTTTWYHNLEGHNCKNIILYLDENITLQSPILHGQDIYVRVFMT
jgi:hypothetical protein